MAFAHVVFPFFISRKRQDGSSTTRCSFTRSCQMPMQETGHSENLRSLRCFHPLTKRIEHNFDFVCPPCASSAMLQNVTSCTCDRCNGMAPRVTVSKRICGVQWPFDRWLQMAAELRRRKSALTQHSRTQAAMLLSRQSVLRLRFHIGDANGNFNSIVE